MKLYLASARDVQIQIEYGGEWIVFYSNDLPNKAFAKLVMAELDRLIDTRIRSIRRSAYELGWKDAKAKRRKRTNWISGCINSIRADEAMS